jgi:hypothetical protein
MVVLLYYGCIVVFVILTVCLHIVLALAVKVDARYLIVRDPRSGTFLGGPELWFFATLLGGLFAAFIYWVIHHSTLRLQQEPRQEKHSPTAT